MGGRERFHKSSGRRRSASPARARSRPDRSATVVVQKRLGLHARPAALFVRLAKTFDAEIEVRKGRQRVNGKSIMGILLLAAEQGSRVTIRADGPDAKAAIEALVHFVATPLEN